MRASLGRIAAAALLPLAAGSLACASGLSLRLERPTVALDGSPQEAPVRSVAVLHHYFPTMPLLAIGDELAVGTDEVGRFLATERRPWILRLVPRGDRKQVRRVR